MLPGITPHNRAGPIKVTHMAIGSDRYPNINTYPPGYLDENAQNKSKYFSCFNYVVDNSILREC